MLHIIVNGKPMTVAAETTILGCIESLGLNPEIIVVERNGDLPPRSDWGEVLLLDNDRLELVKFIGGG